MLYFITTRQEKKSRCVMKSSKICLKQFGLLVVTGINFE